MIATQMIDTNVLIRFFVGDNATQHGQAEKWFQEAESGKRKIVIKSLVVAETSFVLESFYKKTKSEIADTLTVMLTQKWLIVEEREVLIRLMSWYRQGLHFVDSYLLASSEENITILSFDRELLKKLREKNE